MSENNEFNMQDLNLSSNEKEENQQFNNEQTNIPYYIPNDQPQKPQNSGLAIASLVLGILGIICCAGCGPLFSILAIIFYFVDKSNNGTKSSLAKAGLICGIVGLVSTVLIVILSFTTAFLEAFTESLQ